MAIVWWSQLFAVSWAAGVSSAMLILWGLDHVVPWRRRPNASSPSEKWEHWRDALLLIGLGCVDWVHAAKGVAEIDEVQKATEPRRINPAQTDRIVQALSAKPRPIGQIEIWIDDLPNQHERREVATFVDDFKRALTMAGWPAIVVSKPGQLDFFGVRVRYPCDAGTTDLPGASLYYALNAANLSPGYDCVAPGEPTRIMIGRR